jgi:Flp pilus assembly protein TadD
MISPIPPGEIAAIRALSAQGRHMEALRLGERLFAAHLHSPEFYEALGLASAGAGRFDQALELFKALSRFAPGDWQAFYNAGRALEDLRRWDEAVDWYEEARRLNPDWAQIRNNLGNVLTELLRYDEGASEFAKAIALEPGHAEAHNNLGAVLYRLGRRAEAARCFEEAIGLKPDYAEAYCNLAQACLIDGRLDEGFALNEWRKRCAVPRGARLLDRPMLQGLDGVEGRTVFLHWEQGFGDTLQFVRYIEPLRARGARVALSAQEPLISLLGRWEPEIEILGPSEAPEAFDAHCPLMSLPLVFGTTLDSVPRIPSRWSADPGRVEDWMMRPRRRRGPRVGLVWSGSTAYRQDKVRSIPFERLSPLFETGADFISLQKEPPAAEEAALAASPVLDVRDCLKDFADTAALISGLDLVISVDTATAHLAGSLGKPVWILLPFAPDWRWLAAGENSRWYPTARLFRQAELGDWDAVIERAARELAAAVSGSPPPQ